MNTLYLTETTQTQDGWQTSFAFQVFHRSPDEWLKMRWGFNAAALLDEALDRQKLFVESQAVSEDMFLMENQTHRTLALRGINVPGVGVQIALLGKVNSHDRAQAPQEAQNYAREIFSVFPHDFILHPIESKQEYEHLYGTAFITPNSSVALIQRANAFIPSVEGSVRIKGLWQSSVRTNEQIWRALSNMPCATILNIVIQPSVLYEGDKKFLLELKAKSGSEEKGPVANSSCASWMDNYVKRRLAIWKKFFLLQVQVLADENIDDNFLRSIGSALTRDTNETPLPGFQVVRPNSIKEEKEWRERICALNLVPSPLRIDDVADLEEVYSVFRFPYLPETGLHGVNFIKPID